MTAETAYLLRRLEAVETAQPADHPLQRIDQGESENVSDNIREMRQELRQANYVHVATTDASSSIRGAAYNLNTTVTVRVRITGLDHSEYGHIDPEGVEGVPFYDRLDANGAVLDDGLVTQVRDRILADRKQPAVGGSAEAYNHIGPPNETPRSYEYGDFYDHVIQLELQKIERP